MNGRNRSIGHAPCAGDAGEVNAKRARDATAKGEYSLGPVNEGKLMSKHETHAESRAPADPGRREFVAASAAVGLATAAVSGSPAALGASEHQVVERDVEVKTPDGTCDAALLHPAVGKHPAVLVWTDVFGLRPAFRELGRRLAAQGYTVLVPNPFYRTARSPVVTDASTFDFTNPADRAKTQQWTGPINQPGAIERDAQAHIAFLDAAAFIGSDFLDQRYGLDQGIE